MRLRSARVKDYKSINDTGIFEVERDKTILVGINESGKSAILQALQQLNPPKEVEALDPLRDYPRLRYNDIDKGRVNPGDVLVVCATFDLEPEDLEILAPEIRGNITGFQVRRYLDNRRECSVVTSVPRLTFKDLAKDLVRMAMQLDRAAGLAEPPRASNARAQLETLVPDSEGEPLSSELRVGIGKWLESLLPDIPEGSELEEKYDAISGRISSDASLDAASERLEAQLPTFVLFSNYFRVRARLQLEALARKQAGKEPIDRYDYGNICLLNLLGFTAQELNKLGRITDEERKQLSNFGEIAKRLDERGIKLDAAEAMLTREIREIWNPDPSKDEAKTLRITADGPYLKVTVEDALGAKIDLDQRSEGFQWLVSFFVVFFSEAEGQHKNAILLLDEPGVSLHALKQREFQKTISRLSAGNQTIFTTHSPFLVGAGELDLVRVVELTNRESGTRVHTSVTSNDPASLLPLQEALGYDMAHSLFANERNLVTEGLTDYFYVESMGELLRSSGVADLNPKIALVPAGDAGKVVYFATILHAHKLKVAALLDADGAGENAAKQETLVHALKQKAILRTKDYLNVPVGKAEIEDLLRDTLVRVAKDDLGWDVEAKANDQRGRPIVDIFSDQIAAFSKYKLAKAFIRWCRTHEAADLTQDEREQWKRLVEAVNRALR